MESTDFAAFKDMLALTAEQYGKSMSPELMRFYFEGLAHLPLAIVRAAFNAHIRNPAVGQFMPKVADIIRAAQPDLEAEAVEALRLMNRDDPITTKVIESMGGWRSWGMRDEQEWHTFGGPEFLKRYQIYAKQERETGAALNATRSLPSAK